MVKDKFVRKFFVALLENGGSMTHYHLARKVFGSNWSRAQLDELVNAPLIAPLVVTTTDRVTRIGRVPRRYTLAPGVWPIAERWRLLSPSAPIPPESLRERLEELAKAGNEWASDLTRYAAFGKKMWEAEPPKERKTRYRSPAQIEKRRQWVRNKELERLRAGTVEPAAPTQPRTPTWGSRQPKPTRVPQEAPVAPASGSHSGTGGF